ncbi:MAG: hypothetical protein RIR12_290 [Bacteroidota bacterium]|jgi:ribosomal protein L20
MENVHFFAFATLGHPSDFQQACLLSTKNKLAHKIKLFELTHAIKVFPKSKLYSVRFERINGEVYISYSIYTYTKELLSDRDGTFIGSSFLFSNEVPDESIVIENLVKFHNIITSKNVKDDRLLINHVKDFTLPKSIYNDFNSITFNATKLDSNLELSNSNSSIVVWSTELNLANSFKKVVELFEKYDTIYLTESKEIAEFARSRGIYKTINKTDFINEINTLSEERNRKRELSISEFKIEIQRIDEAKKQTILEYKNLIEQNERAHLENDRKLKESKDNITKIEQFFDDFLNKTNLLINHLSNNSGKLDEVKQAHNRNKTLFNNGISDFKRPNYNITSISKPKPKGNLHVEHERQVLEQSASQKNIQNWEKDEKITYKVDIFKLATFVLSFLLLLTWIYFLFIKSNSKTVNPIIPKREVVTNSSTEHGYESSSIDSIADLNPISNSILNENDYRIVASKLKTNMRLDSVVNLIFHLNPKEINTYYSNQAELYGKYLVQKNQNCFLFNNESYYFITDTLKTIPAYKKNL